MGKLRSKSGCLTCRSRRVKCDEVRPTCGQCSTKSRSCQWEPSHTTFKGYQPKKGSSSKAAVDDSGEGTMEEDGEDTPNFFNLSPERRNSSGGATAAFSSEPVSSSHSVSTLFHQPSTYTSSTSPFVASPAASSTGGVSLSGLLHSESYSSDGSPFIPLPTATPITLSHDEALFVHHYAEHLGRWLDCTDASRQFSLKIPLLVKHCPILLRAVLSFAARHRQDTEAADQAYEACIALLIERLNLKSAMNDESLLCAIVVLRFFEQLNVPPVTGSDFEQHLTGTSALLRASQGKTVDPSAPTLRDAAFWVYVRQSLYSATVNQQPPNIDFTVQLHPTPASIGNFHSMAEINRETTWANAMTWLCASVVNFCFDEMNLEPASRMRRSLELWDALEKWKNERPASFNPIWSGPPGDTSVFPEIWFTADWHVMAFGFYHFSSLLLITYKPGPKFARRNVGGKLTEQDHQVLEHARAICGSCKCSPATVPNLITLCHTVFIWGPLMSRPEERNEVIGLLVYLENTHVWPTTWIVNALKGEWGMAD